MTSSTRSDQLNSTSNSLESYCSKWSLEKPIRLANTFTSDVYKVKLGSEDAVLKILNEKGKKFEVKGATVLRCFDGNGAVRLMNADAGAHLLEFIDGPELKTLVEQGKDELASEILCDVIDKIHSYPGPLPEDLISMERNFRSLFERAERPADLPIYERGAKIARELIAAPKGVRVLHGDIHHENILKHPARGWLLIDPQCLQGERTYDLANAFYNPNGFENLVVSPERIMRLCNVFSRRLEIDKQRILEYAFAYGCLSACWCIEDGQNPDPTLKIAMEIERLLNKGLD